MESSNVECAKLWGHKGHLDRDLLRSGPQCSPASIKSDPHPAHSCMLGVQGRCPRDSGSWYSSGRGCRPREPEGGWDRSGKAENRHTAHVLGSGCDSPLKSHSGLYTESSGSL